MDKLVQEWYHCKEEYNIAMRDGELSRPVFQPGVDYHARSTFHTQFPRVVDRWAKPLEQMRVSFSYGMIVRGSYMYT